jgi:TRAP-type C4-dicarboxylate transport system substrate-binding protein
MKKFLVILSLLCLLLTGTASANKSLEKWRPDFDPKGAKYKCIVSNVTHPVIKGSYAGFAIRDAVWEATNGQIYVDYKPLSMLGGEVEVLNLLQMGAIQGMGVSSVAATNMGQRFGLVNLPFLVDSFEKLEKFVNNEKLFSHFLNAADSVGITGLDITGYGHYGWATTTPVKTIEDAKKIKFRIAEAEVNQLLYRSWGFQPVVMPWPDVPVALKQNVITGLDHTPMVCNITKKFEAAKYFTQVNYAQGLFIWVFNKAWLNSLPEDLRAVFEKTVHDVCAKIRSQTQSQENEEIEKASENGIEFIRLSEEDTTFLKQSSAEVHEKYAPGINRNYPGDEYKPENYLKEVQQLLLYSK